MKRLGALLMALGAVLIACSLVLVARNMRDAKKAGDSSAQILQELRPLIEAQAEEPSTGESGMPVLPVDGYDYLGVVSIPSVDISLPVMDTWDYTRMKLAPCRYTGSLDNNDLVICAHNYARQFSTLRRVEVGAQVFFTAADGVTHAYRAVSRETVPQTAVEYVTDGGDWDLTLFTCESGGVTRCIVRCERVHL